MPIALPSILGVGSHGRGTRESLNSPKSTAPKPRHKSPKVEAMLIAFYVVVRQVISICDNSELPSSVLCPKSSLYDLSLSSTGSLWERAAMDAAAAAADDDQAEGRESAGFFQRDPC